MTPEQIRAKKSGLYATCDSLEELITNYNMKGANVAILMIAVNTTLEMLAKEAEANDH